MFKNIFTAIFLFFIFILLPKEALASSLYLSPGSASVAVGQTVNIQVRLNTAGDAVNAVSAVLSYPADKLDVAYINYGSSFGIAAEGSYGGGSIRIARGSISPVSGNVNVATIGFRGKAAGSARAVFVGGSAAPRASDSSDSLNLGGSSGATLTVGGSAPAQPAASKKPGATIPTSVNDSKKPIITDLKITSIATNSAIIKWKTDERADSVIEFGLEKDKYFLNVSKSFMTLDHSIELESPLLIAGTKLHFRAKSKDPSGNEAVSEDLELQLKGYKVEIKILDNSGKPLANTEVLLYSEPKKQTTNQNGVVSFQDVSPGKHLVVVKKGVLEKSKEIEVNSTEQLQNFEIKVDFPLAILPMNINPLYLLALLPILVIIIALLLGRRYWRKKQASIPPPNQTQ